MKKMMRQQQLKVDENLIRAYLKQNQIHDFHYTDSGVYYMIQQQGSMRKPQKGDTVLVNYTGYLLDGSKFDSNVLPDFHHVTPFKFKLGVGAVIPGWDMALPLFGLGGKGTIIIPSRYAYGPYGNGDAIKPDAILVFDIELLDIK
jgi:FKBP-type peptidyl-prolyl cis-trans isomerase